MLKYFITSKAKRKLLKLFFFNRNSAFYTREIARLADEPLNAVRRELGYLEKAGLLRSYMQGNQKYYEIVKTFPFLAEWEKIILGTPDTTMTSTAMSKSPKTPKLSRSEPATITARSEMVQPSSANEPIIPGARVIMRREAAQRPPEAIEPSTIEPSAVHAQIEAIEQHPDTSEISFVTASDEIASPPQISTTNDLAEYLRQQFIHIGTIHMALIHGDSVKQEQIPPDGVDLLIIGDISKDSLLTLIAEIEDEISISINLTSMSRSDFEYRNARGDTFIRHIWSEKKLVVKGRH